VASLLVEGGPRLAASFFEAGLYDRLEVVAAGLLLGGASAPGPIAGAGAPLAAAPRLGKLTPRRVGGDVVLTGWNRACSRELSRKLAG
jgi:diaminohydroxyphosphoribosylaminopyrimidine deaminase/5-amino-6-(5-phosphoribosylamino)uracil reductase